MPGLQTGVCLCFFTAEKSGSVHCLKKYCPGYSLVRFFWLRLKNKVRQTLSSSFFNHSCQACFSRAGIICRILNIMQLTKIYRGKPGFGLSCRACQCATLVVWRAKYYLKVAGTATVPPAAGFTLLKAGSLAIARTCYSLLAKSPLLLASTGFNGTGLVKLLFCTR